MHTPAHSFASSAFERMGPMAEEPCLALPKAMINLKTSGDS